MHKFEYRVPRFAVDLTVRFIVQNLTHVARCREISINGMMLELMQPLRADSRGTLLVSYKERTIEIGARVAHVGEVFGGLEFIYQSDAERDEIAHLVAAVSTPASRPGPVLLK